MSRYKALGNVQAVWLRIKLLIFGDIMSFFSTSIINPIRWIIWLNALSDFIFNKCSLLRIANAVNVVKYSWNIVDNKYFIQKMFLSEPYIYKKIKYFLFLIHKHKVIRVPCIRCERLVNMACDFRMNSSHIQLVIMRKNRTTKWPNCHFGHPQLN